MTGHPLLRLCILVAALLVLAGAISRLTAERPRLEPQIEIVAPDPVVEEFTVLFDSPIRPARIRISSAGEAIAELMPDRADGIEISLNVGPGDRSIDWVIESEWPPGEPPVSNALRVRVMRKDSVVVDATFWGDPDVADVLTISGGGAFP